MALDQYRREFQLANGLAARLRGAWRALLGHSAVVGNSAATRAIEQSLTAPQALLIEQLIGGMPAAAIVLDREGRVIAFNQAATTIAPALSHGELALIALRMPELVDAVRRAANRRERQSVEFFERVPLDRWLEAFVSPVRSQAAGKAPSISC